MFGMIAPRYDFLNHLLSLGIDTRWRRAAVERICCGKGGLILDIATGTGDMACAAADATEDSVRIVGVDFCGEMVEIARRKIAASSYGKRIGLGIASCEALPFLDNTFTSATIAFGIRNVVDRKLGLSEVFRVLKPGGEFVVLEFSEPRAGVIRHLFGFYFRRILPAIGGLFSDTGAYRYLPDSVARFPDRDAFASMLSDAGFTDIVQSDFSFGIVTIFTGRKALISS
jgi:demethylmenaquinone methyltransferase/2-methoxy-6-polyprenyl-1,4-benzoquinol methylase